MEHENQIVVNQLRRSVVDQEMVVDGVVFRERKELNNITDDEGNQEKSFVFHTKWIGSDKLEKTRVVFGGLIIEEIIETNFCPGKNLEYVKMFENEFNSKFVCKK